MIITMEDDKLELYGGPNGEEIKVLFCKKGGKWYRIFPDKVSEEISEEKISEIKDFIRLFLRRPLKKLHLATI